jgi:hypothetical protein
MTSRRLINKNDLKIYKLQRITNIRCLEDKKSRYHYKQIPERPHEKKNTETGESSQVVLTHLAPTLLPRSLTPSLQLPL